MVCGALTELFVIDFFIGADILRTDVHQAYNLYFHPALLSKFYKLCCYQSKNLSQIYHVTIAEYVYIIVLL